VTADAHEQSEAVGPPIDLHFRPQSQSAALPVETFRRRELLGRLPDAHFRRRQRAHFHQLVVCVEGAGHHVVDFERFALSPGAVLRIRPGQNQQFDLDGDPECLVVVWPPESDPVEPWREPWFPGSSESVWTELSLEQLARVRTLVGELATEQVAFDGTRRQIELMKSLLRAVLLLIEGVDGRVGRAAEVMPQPYLDLRAALERELYARPSVASLASALGYSTRTLDRACGAVSGQTARQVIDERMALELRRRLADETVSLADVRRSFGFDDTSNFTKFVRRHLGRSPADVRTAPL